MSTMPRWLLGIDPGRKTGVAVLDLLLETCTGTEEPFENLGFKLEELISTLRPAVICENFVININTVKNTQATWSIEGIGIARYLATKYDCPFEVQAQSSAKRFVTNDRLRALGWYVPGKGHLADGQRQALLYAVRHGWWTEGLSIGDNDDIMQLVH